MGFYAPHVLVGDARRHGLQVLRVAINSSHARCMPINPQQILLGFETVKGIGSDLAKAIVAERVAHGPYLSLPDLLRRTALPRHAAEHLITVGALAEFGLGRRELLWQLGLLAGDTHPVARTRQRPATPERYRQVSLGLPTDQDMVQLKDMTDWERMVADYTFLGLSPSYHPMSLLRPGLPSDVLTAARVRASADTDTVRTGGLVVCRQRPGTAKGFVFLLLEDETGVVNVIIRPDMYEAQRSLLRAEPYLCVEGKIQLHSGSLNLIATRVTSLSDLTQTETVLPRAPERNHIPGYSHDPREMASAELAHSAPPSRNFH
jgi:error-prone DNA polymerase